jgi:hypothetical protein
MEKRAMTPQPETTGPQAMVWPTLRHKLGCPRVFCWPCYAGFSINFRDWYFGNYLLISIGWFAFACGGGIYE